MKKAYILLSILIVLLVAAQTVIFILFPNLHQFAQNRAGDDSNRMSVMNMVHDQSELNKMNTSLGQLRFEIPTGTLASDIKVVTSPIDREISLYLNNVEASYFEDHPVVGSTEHISDMYFDYGSGEASIDFAMDGVYEPVTKVDDHYIYLSFLNPREVYDYIVVIDAACGGDDDGYSAGDVHEKDVTLDVVQRMKRVLDQQGRQNVGIYYTRLSDRKIYLKERAELAEELGADLFLSVRLNSTATGRESDISGVSVLYQVADTSGRSYKFASICLDHLLDGLGASSRGVLPGDEDYIVRTADMPIAVAGLGYVTNAAERERMGQEEYREEAASALCASIQEALDSDLTKK